MAYAELQTYAVSDGPEILLCYVNDITVGIFMSLFLLSIWLIMTLGSFFITKKSTGSGDFPVSMSLGSFTTFIASVFFRLITCPNLPLTSDLNFAVVIGITFLSVIFLFFSRD